MGERNVLVGHLRKDEEQSKKLSFCSNCSPNKSLPLVISPCHSTLLTMTSLLLLKDYTSLPTSSLHLLFSLMNDLSVCRTSVKSMPFPLTSGLQYLKFQFLSNLFFCFNFSLVHIFVYHTYVLFIYGLSLPRECKLHESRNFCVVCLALGTIVPGRVLGHTRCSLSIPQVNEQ